MKSSDRPALETEMDCATDEVEISPEMIEAGARLLCEYFDTPLDWLTEYRAREIYVAMTLARPK